MLPCVGLPWAPGEGVKWSDMPIISDTGMPAKGTVWESGREYQVSYTILIQGHFQRSRREFTWVTGPESLVQQDAQLPMQG